MKKLLTLLSIVLSVNVQAQTNDYILNPSFNGGVVHEDFQYAFNTTPRMKKMNDSTFVYHVNYNVSGKTNNRYVFVKQISHNGNVNQHILVEENNFLNIIDVFCDNNNSVYVIRKSNNQETRLYKYDYNGTTWNISSSFGTSGLFTYNTEPIGYDVKGLIEGGVPVLYGSSPQSTNDRNFLARLAITNNGANHSLSYINSNQPANTYSDVADVIAISSTETIIADNACVLNSSNFTYTQTIPRLWKISSGAVSTTFGSSGVKTLGWQSYLFNSPTSGVRKLLKTSDNKILVVGFGKSTSHSNNEVIRVSRINFDGTNDNTFTINNSFAIDPFLLNIHFVQTAIERNGNYIIGGNRSSNFAFLIELKQNGELDTTKGTAGVMTTNASLNGLYGLEFRNNGRLIINGAKPFSQFNSAFNLGEYIFDGQSTSSINEIDKSSIKLFPNPANNRLNIDLLNEAEIEIYSLTGVLMDKFSAKQNHIVDVSAYPSGMYFVKTQNETIKFVKQ